MSDLIARFTRELEERPDDPSALSNLATALFEAGRREESLPHIQRAAELTPDNPVILYNLGNTLRELGRHAEAAERFRGALALKPPRQVAVAAAHCLGSCLKAAGDLDGAMEQYRFALDIDPRYGLSHYNLANTLRDIGRGEEAIEHYRLALEGQHDRKLAVSIRVNLGLLLETLEQPQEAEGHFRRALLLDPTEQTAILGLIRLTGK